MQQNLKYYYFKENIIKLVREFFFYKDFHEVTIPVLNQTIPLQEHIQPFTTEWHFLDRIKKLYLTTSPEAYLKYMLAQGLEKCFAIGHSFRNNEDANQDHNPEFLMLEWYRSEATMNQIMTDIQNLIKYLINQSPKIETQPKFKFDQGWPQISLETLCQQYLNHSIKELENLKLLNQIAAKNNIPNNNNWHELFDHLMLNLIEPHLPQESPFYLVDFPSKSSPFCTCKQKQTYLAQRFELYLNGHEIANGNQESTNYTYIRKIFDRLSHQTKYPISYRFLDSLKKMQRKKYAGVGLGLERLMMILGNIDSLQKITTSNLI